MGDLGCMGFLRPNRLGTGITARPSSCTLRDASPREDVRAILTRFLARRREFPSTSSRETARWSYPTGLGPVCYLETIIEPWSRPLVEDAWMVAPVSPTRELSGDYLKEHGEALHHIAFRVPDTGPEIDSHEPTLKRWHSNWESRGFAPDPRRELS